MPAEQTESAPSFLQVYMQVRRDRMKHSSLRQISGFVDWRRIIELALLLTLVETIARYFNGVQGFNHFVYR